MDPAWKYSPMVQGCVPMNSSEANWCVSLPSLRRQVTCRALHLANSDHVCCWKMGTGGVVNMGTCRAPRVARVARRASHVSRGSHTYGNQPTVDRTLSWFLAYIIGVVCSVPRDALSLSLSLSPTSRNGFPGRSKSNPPPLPTPSNEPQNRSASASLRLSGLLRKLHGGPVGVATESQVTSTNAVGGDRSDENRGPRA